MLMINIDLTAVRILKIFKEGCGFNTVKILKCQKV